MGRSDRKVVRLKIGDIFVYFILVNLNDVYEFYSWFYGGFIFEM